MPTLILITQCETARINFAKTVNTHIVVNDIVHCVVVAFRDQHHNLSVTHVDTNTDLSFIKREAEKMVGKFTIDVIKLSSSESILAQKVVYPYIRSNLGEIPNSKNTMEVRKTNTEVVIFTPDKMLCIEDMHLTQIRSYNKHVRHLVPRSNPLYNDTLEEGFKPCRLRVRERQLKISIDNGQSLPPVVYDSGKWTGEYYSLDEDTRKKLNVLRTLNPAQQIEYATKKVYTLQKRDPANSEMIQLLPTNITRTDMYRAQVRYTPISEFFKAQSFPAMVVDIIGQYDTDDNLLDQTASQQAVQGKK